MPLMTTPSTLPSEAIITWLMMNGRLARHAGHLGDLLHHLLVLGQVARVLGHHRVRVGAEDLLLQVRLEAAHHREHDDQRHHAHAHAAHGERGHHHRWATARAASAG